MQPVHLLTLVHGMWGHPGHLSEMARIAKETLRSQEQQDEVCILLAEANTEEGTYDGVDWCAERVVEEIIQEINRLRAEENKIVHKFSITGYSLGGLVSRYTVGILAQRGFFSDSSSTQIHMTPTNFDAIATPHIGLVRYQTVFSHLAHALGPKLLSRTGEQFYLKDEWSRSGRPLLDIMSDPNLIFYQALTQFKQVRIFANTVQDTTVPYVTAAIEEEDPFVDWDGPNGEESPVKIEFHPKYRPIISSFSVSPPSLQPTQSKSKKKAKKSKPSLGLPPFLIRPFPWNILVYILLPLLIPLVFVIVFVKFTRATSRSRGRIQLLERSETGKQSLVSVIGAGLREGAMYLEKMEKRFEDAVANVVDDPMPVDAGTATSGSESESSPLTSGSSTPSTSVSYGSTSTSLSSYSPTSFKHGPSLTPLQRTLCRRLNSLPGLKKQLALIDSMDLIATPSSGSDSKSAKSRTRRPIRNSHATIVSRDVKNYEFHRIGEGVLRCWAEGLVV